VRIRHLDGKDDVRGIHRVNVLAWRAAYDDLLSAPLLAERDVDPSQEQVDDRFDRLRDNGDRFLVAVDETGTIRGYSYVRWGEETKAFVGKHEAGLKEIYVEPNYWSEGIGTRLLESGIDLLPEEITALKVEALSGNEVGEQFYEARGFERIGKGEVEIGDETIPTIVYVLELR
jgi:GNAT superfamily N-acetyltransferase